MRALIEPGAAGLIAVAVGVCLNAASRATADSVVGRATLAPSISPVSKDTALAATINILEMHNRAHLENLPVEEVDEQNLVFGKEARHQSEVQPPGRQNAVGTVRRQTTERRPALFVKKEPGRPHQP